MIAPASHTDDDSIDGTISRHHRMIVDLVDVVDLLTRRIDNQQEIISALLTMSNEQNLAIEKIAMKVTQHIERIDFIDEQILSFRH